MLNKITAVAAFISIAFAAAAQKGEEQLVPLTGNPILRLKDHQLIQQHPNSFVRKTGIKDTLLLPFFEDFSGGEVFPNENRWTDRNAYINTDFPVKPPSIGVATLDAIDSTGRPYLNIRPDIFGPCDTLTSQPINLAGLTPGNNVYLSFAYQRQGWGFPGLKAGDSLVVQFKNSQGFWYNKWVAYGGGPLQFLPAIIKVDTLPYFHAGFQFRFINYQNYEGGVGHWHLDYIYLEQNRNGGDTIFPDVTLVQKPASILKEYQEMPYPQYRGFEIAETPDSVWGKLGNTGDVGRTVDIFNRVVWDNTLFPLSSRTRSGLALNAQSDSAYNFIGSIGVNSQPGDSAQFYIAENLKITGANFKVANDSFVRKLNFANYYAYDDGTAETGYSLSRGTGKIAYGFRTNKPDTLRAISVYFYQAVDTIKKPFSLAVWSSINPGASGDQLVYSHTVSYPSYTDSINGFHTYLLDSVVPISGTFYIGWIQSSIFDLQVGWDRNYTLNNQAVANPRLYFNTTGKWYNSEIPGTLMMRPHLGRDFVKDTTLVNVDLPIRAEKGLLTVYPNPAQNTLTVVQPGGLAYNYTITDVTGKTVQEGFLTEGVESPLNTSYLENGLYFLTLHSQNNGQYFSKFIKH